VSGKAGHWELVQTRLEVTNAIQSHGYVVSQQPIHCTGRVRTLWGHRAPRAVVYYLRFRSSSMPVELGLILRN